MIGHCVDDRRFRVLKADRTFFDPMVVFATVATHVFMLSRMIAVSLFFRVERLVDLRDAAELLLLF